MKKNTILLVIVIAILIVCSLPILYLSSEDYSAPIYFEGLSEAGSGNSLDTESPSTSSNSKIITVIIQTISECPDGIRPSEGDYSISEVMSILSEHRKEVKEYYQVENQGVIEQLNLKSISSDIRFSSYAPFVYFSIPEDEYYKKYEEIISLRKSINVTAIYIRTTQEISAPLLAEAITASNGDYYINNGIYDGTGIVIGILDVGIISQNNANFDDTDITIRFNLFNSPSEHATTVASIAAGSSGVARGASLLSAQKFGSYFNEEVEWMIDNGVNVINMSMWDLVYSNLGSYSSQSAYLDYIVRNTWVSYVGAAGNNQEDENLVTSPSTGFNTLTVGSTDNLGDLSYYSSYGENFEISKPTLVAPGEDFSVPNLGDQGSGTSYSAPLVTGTIALMMEKKSLLMLYPEAIIAILTSSTNSLSYNNLDSSGLEDSVGAGLLNIASSLVNTGTVQTFSNSSDHIGEVIYSKSVYLVAGRTIRISSVQLVNSDQSTTSMVTNYDLFLQYNGSNVASAESTYNNIEFIEYTATVTGYYYIRYKQIAAKTTTHTDFIGVQYVIITPSC